MAGKKAAEILKGNKRPTELESELMDPPLWLVNKESMREIGLTLPKAVAADVSWVEGSH